MLVTHCMLLWIFVLDITISLFLVTHIMLLWILLLEITIRLLIMTNNMLLWIPHCTSRYLTIIYRYAILASSHCNRLPFSLLKIFWFLKTRVHIIYIYIYDIIHDWTGWSIINSVAIIMILRYPYVEHRSHVVNWAPCKIKYKLIVDFSPSSWMISSNNVIGVGYQQ